MVKIKVRCDEREFCYKLSPVHTTVLHIKQLALDSSFDDFSLKWEGKVLKDTDSLAQCGIVTDATLSLQPRYRAGSGHESGGCFGAFFGGGGGAASRAASNAIHPNSTEVDIHIYIVIFMKCDKI